METALGLEEVHYPVHGETCSCKRLLSRFRLHAPGPCTASSSCGCGTENFPHHNSESSFTAVKHGAAVSVSLPKDAAAPPSPRPLRRHRLGQPPSRILHGVLLTSRVGNNPPDREGDQVAGAARLLRFAEPPCASHLIVPAHLAEHPDTDPDGDEVCLLYGGLVKVTSGDGLVLLAFMDIRATAPVVSTDGDNQERKLTGVDLDIPMTRFVCNPLSGQMFRLPDMDGTKKTAWFSDFGILTQSECAGQPPDRYAVAVLTEDGEGEDRSFVMRRFLSQTGEWEKVEGLPSPLPLARSMNIDSQVVAFAGRLWWVDFGWGAVSADPFSDRPDLRFVELPRGSVTEPMEEQEWRRRRRDKFRGLGVSEGRLNYAEVSQEKPFVLSSFALDDDGSCWTLEHRVALSRILPQGNYLSGKSSPQIGFVDPLRASVRYLTVNKQLFSVDMERKKVLSCSMNAEGAGLSCLLPPWLGSSRIPSPGTVSSTKANVKTQKQDFVGHVDSH